MDRREHDRRPPTEHQIDTESRFDHFIFVPGLYENPGSPCRLRVFFEEDHGLTEISDEQTTSDGTTAQTYENRHNVHLECTSTQTRWLHRTLGALIDRWDAATPAPVVTTSTAEHERLTEALEILERCRPHIAMATSVTSGREFRETTEALLLRLDRLLAKLPPHSDRCA